MARTLLVGSPGASWREWERRQIGDADLLILDPTDTLHGCPAVMRLMRGDHPVWSRLYGSLDPRRAPHVLLAGLAEAISRADEDLIVRLFAYRNTPLLRQTVMLAASILQPDRILVAEGTDIDLNGFPVGPELIPLEPGFPPMVQEAMRKAQWMKLLELSSPHQVEFRSVTLEGSRLGSGRPLLPDEMRRAGVEEALYVEQAGRSLLIVAEEVEEGRIARAQDVTGAQRVVLVDPSAYDGLLIAFVRGNGEEFGHGRIDRIDWKEGILHAQTTAVPPVPVQVVRLGSLRIDPKGGERGEARPWEV